MSRNVRSDHFSDQQIGEYALKLRRYHEVADGDCPDVVTALKRGRIWTRFGEKDLLYKVVDDLDLPNEEGLTDVTDTQATITIPKSTLFRAEVGDGRARMTLAHEFGHAVLHKNQVSLARARVETGVRFIRASQDVEHHAKVFAAAYLISDAVMVRCRSADELAEECCISLQAATIRWEQFQRQNNRESMRARFAALSNEIAAQNRPNKNETRYSICPSCQAQALSEIGVKFYCAACGHLSDILADGDSA